METTNTQPGLTAAESRTVMVGFRLTGIVIAVTGVSYVLNMTFAFQWLVWVIGVAFMAVALLALEWPRAYRHAPGEIPKGRLR